MNETQLGPDFTRNRAGCDVDLEKGTRTKRNETVTIKKRFRDFMPGGEARGKVHVNGTGDNWI